MDKYDQLESLNSLRQRGALTEDEFQTEKGKILGNVESAQKINDTKSSAGLSNVNNKKDANSTMFTNNRSGNKSISGKDIKDSIEGLIDAIDDEIFGILFYLILASGIYVNWSILSGMNGGELRGVIPKLLGISVGAWLIVAGMYFLIAKIKSESNSRRVRIFRIIAGIIFSLFMIIGIFQDNETVIIGTGKNIQEAKKVSYQNKEIEGNSKDVTNNTTKKSLQDYIDEGSMHVALSDPMTVDPYINQNERTKLAIDTIEEGLVNYPNSSELYSLKADIFNFRYKQYDDALKLYNKAISIDKTNSDAYIGKITLLMSQNKLDDARETFDVIYKIDPNNSTLEIYRTMLKK